MSVSEALSQSIVMPTWWRRMDASQRILTGAFALSTFAHAAVLAIQFSAPDSFRLVPTDNKLDVIIVNAKHNSKPSKAEALANANLDGGGEAQKGRAKSFLPNLKQTQDGEAIRETRVRMQELEAEQRRLLMQMQGKNKMAAAEIRPEQQPDPVPPQPNLSGTDLIASASAILRREAELNKRIEDENARPKRAYLSPSTREVVYALYFRQWAEKVERIGNNNYPEAARGNSHSLIMTVSLLPDGSIEKIEIDRGSGNKTVDRAAERIVRLGEPYGRFSQAMRERIGVVSMTMRWTFSRGDALAVEGSN